MHRLDKDTSGLLVVAKTLTAQTALVRHQKFEGTVLLVTHDQDLLEEVGTRVWQFEKGRVVDFKGTYEELTASVA